MSIETKIPPLFARYTGHQKSAEVNGSTVGECLDDLIRQFPEFKQALFDKNGRLHRHLDIYVNRTSAYPEELAKAVKDGDELRIMMIFSGG
jgi:molybdopterin converting factor small subunit